jgi:hypothetical protein
VTLWNAVHDISSTLGLKWLRIEPNGDVFWSRNGAAAARRWVVKGTRAAGAARLGCFPRGAPTLAPRPPLCPPTPSTGQA